MESGFVGGVRLGGSWDGSVVFDIDPAVGEPPVEGVGVVGEFALDPFEVGKAGAIGEFVEHSGGDEVG